jgi:hypothetical protein
MDNNNKHILRELIKIRINDYKIDRENELFYSYNLQSLIGLILGIIKKIIYTNNENDIQANQMQYEHLKQQLSFLAKEKPDSFIFFSSQLVQYYTIICDSELASINTFSKILNYIENKREHFGDVSKNLFIIEYYLIKLYNEIFRCKEEFEHASDTVKTNLKKWLDYDRKKYSSFLTHLSTILEEKIVHFPHSIYNNYLNVVLNYTHALIVEYQLRINADTYQDQEKPPEAFFENQQNYFKKIEKSLDVLETKINKSSCFEPFLLGSDIFSNFPIKTIPEFKAHILTMKK